MNEEIDKITDEYGEVHGNKCALNNEGGSDDGCDCGVKPMVREVVSYIVNFLSHDMDYRSERQRKAGVKMYLNNFFDN